MADWTRREMLRTLGAAGGAGLLGLRAGAAATEPPPEIATIRIPHDPDYPTICYGPQYVAEPLLCLEGFEEVRYVRWPVGQDGAALATGAADFGGGWIADLILQAGLEGSVTLLSGMHIGCAQLYGAEHVRGLRDLGGKRIPITVRGDVSHVFFSLITAYIGLDPSRDLAWVELPYDEWGPAFESGEVDAILLWPPAVQEFRERGIGHLIHDNTVDRPWSQYQCCLLAANREFVERYPVATKRALRAFLKATDLCATDPARAARLAVETGLPYEYERTLQVFREVPYTWRDYDPVDAVRFFSLRLHDIGLLEQTPDEVLAEFSDWRFVNELARELKG